VGKYVGIVVGVIIVAFGIIGLFGWWHYFTALCKGIFPAVLIFAGAVAVIAGLSEIKDESAAKKEEPQ